MFHALRPHTRRALRCVSSAAIGQAQNKNVSGREGMRIAFLLSFAGLCLAIALMLAWWLGITLFYSKGMLAGLIVERADIIRAHIDYLMMAMFLFIFALLFRQYTVKPPIWVIAAACYGAFFNPLGFLIRGITPKAAAAVPAVYDPHFPLPAAITFTLTTIGFLTSVFLIVRAAWKTRNGITGHSQ
jgi:hypothetical protein